MSFIGTLSITINGPLAATAAGSAAIGAGAIVGAAAIAAAGAVAYSYAN